MSRSNDAPSFFTKLTSHEKPKAPLSAYNIFFQLERKRILDGTDILNLPIMPADVRKVCLEYKKKEKTRRLHRKSHGKISFADLARTIASRWRKLDPQSLKALRVQASLEKDEHMQLLKLLNETRQATSGWTYSTISLNTNEKSVPQHPHMMEEEGHCCRYHEDSSQRTRILDVPDERNEHLFDHIEVELPWSILIDNSVESSDDWGLIHSPAYNAVAARIESACCSSMDKMESGDESPSCLAMTSLDTCEDMFAPLDPEEMDKLFDDKD